MVDPLEAAILELSLAESARVKGTRLMQQGDWREAADSFDAVLRGDASVEIRRRLATNLANLQEHRAEIYDLIAATSFTGKYKIIRGNRGRLCIDSLTPGNDPIAFVMDTLAQHKTERPIALCGLGDGWILSTLAESTKQTIIIFEPDPQLILATLAIHDYSAAIVQDRFMWFVGPDWAQQFRKMIAANRNLPLPESNISQGEFSGEIEAAIASIRHEFTER